MLAGELADEPPEILIDDHDTKFTREFDEILKSSGMVVQKPLPHSPNLNAFVERFIQTLQQECLNHFLVVGERHLAHLVREFVSHYHAERPHQSLGNRPPSGSQPSQALNSPPTSGEVVCRERLGGLLKHYERAAA